MVIRGGIRGNGVQLAHYLVSGEANDHVHIVDVAGRLNATDKYLHQTMQGMALTAELTKSQKGLYHAQINPAYGEDRKMTDKDWLKAADILAHELGLNEQRRVIVLHTKKDRTHAHVVFERYDHQTGKVVANKFSRLAQDRARKEMERVFAHQPTPHRNKHRPELKEALTGLWNETTTGAEFIRAVHDNGYMLAEGVPRHPFMVVDENGRSFDLVRQLKGVRIKDVRQRMRHEELIPEKEAIELIRQKQEGGSDSSKAEQQRDTDSDKATRTAAAFWNNKEDATVESDEAQSQKRMENLADNFIQSGQDMTERAGQNNSSEKKKVLAEAYVLNAGELTDAPKIITADTDSKQDIINSLLSDENEDRQKSVADQFATNSAEPIQPSKDAIGKQYRKTLSDFMREGEDMFAKTDPSIEDAQQRQKTVARQFSENQEPMPAPTDDEKEIQKLMQEQKAVRERNRQRGKTRSR